MEHINGDLGMTSDDRGIESHMHLGSGPAGGFRSRGAAERIEDLRDRAGEILGKRTEITSTIRANPIIAVGAAFATGFVIAAVTGTRHRSWAIDRARMQLKRLLIGVATAAIAQEVRSLIDDEDPDELTVDDRQDPGEGAYGRDSDALDDSSF